jgi:hypothetical protein
MLAWWNANAALIEVALGTAHHVTNQRPDSKPHEILNYEL